MKAIYRYPLQVSDSVPLALPRGARVLSVAAGRTDDLLGVGHPSTHIDLWALVDPDLPAETRTFHVVGTGNPAPDSEVRFIGTVALFGGTFIGHVFEDAYIG